MNTLITRAQAIVSSREGVIPNCTDLRIRDGYIVELGTGLQAAADETRCDARNCVIYPGLVNTHHHLAQSVLKGIPAGLNQGLGNWLASVPYHYWPQFDAELMYCAAVIGLAEQLRSGATTCCDHHYLYHAGGGRDLEDALWRAATDLGIRLVLCRGSATTAGSHRGMQTLGLAPEPLQQVLDELDQTRERYHQGETNAMRRLVVAPTSLIHSAEPDHLRALAAYARRHGLKLHSHLLEVSRDNDQAQRRHGMGALEYAADCDWLGPDSWFAHLVHSSAADIDLLAASGTGIAHCPTSNCRLGSGRAPIVAMAQAGIPITLGVDGAGSSESSSMAQELNLCWLLHRSDGDPGATDAGQVLRWGSDNGAQLLGLHDCGDIATGMAADLALYDLSHYRYWGLHSPEWAPVLCGEPVRTKAVFVAGRQVVEDGDVLRVDWGEIAHKTQAGLAQLKRR